MPSFSYSITLNCLAEIYVGIMKLLPTNVKFQSSPSYKPELQDTILEIFGNKNYKGYFPKK